MKVVLCLLYTAVNASVAFQAPALEETFRESLFDVIQTALAQPEVEALIQTSLESIVLDTVTKEVARIISTTINSAFESKVSALVATRLNRKEVQALVLANFEQHLLPIVHDKVQHKRWVESLTSGYGQSKVKTVVDDAIQTTLDLTRPRGRMPTHEEGLWLDDDCPPLPGIQ